MWVGGNYLRWGTVLEDVLKGISKKCYANVKKEKVL